MINPERMRETDPPADQRGTPGFAETPRPPAIHLAPLAAPATLTCASSYTAKFRA